MAILNSCAQVSSGEMEWLWIEEFAEAIEKNSLDLESVQAREQRVGKIKSVLVEAVVMKAATEEQNEGLFQLLGACRVFMRDRRGIDGVLTVEALDTFLRLAESKFWVDRVREEALKCMINSVYLRPEFVSDTLVSMKFASRLLELAKCEGSAAMHWLIWKVLLVACEAPDVPQYLCGSLSAWKLIYTTLFYGFHLGNQADIVVGDRFTLMLDMIKLVAVLVNGMQWTVEQEKLQPEIFETIHQLGGLLMGILQFKHEHTSPLNAALVELKNKTMEVFMFLPSALLAAFIQQQTPKKGDGSKLSPVIDHLHTMLLVVRVEKTRTINEMLPTLIVCHSLAKTSVPQILMCFKCAVLPHNAADIDSCAPTSSNRTKIIFFKHITFFLTCLDTDVRRYAAEWLFLLCDENAHKYTHQTGVGNAIGLLRMKGLA